MYPLQREDGGTEIHIFQEVCKQYIHRRYICDVKSYIHFEVYIRYACSIQTQEKPFGEASCDIRENKSLTCSRTLRGLHLIKKKGEDGRLLFEMCLLRNQGVEDEEGY